MRIGVIIQARMSSRRFPGKSLAVLRDRPLIQYVIERLRKTEIGIDTVVATSDDPSDDPLADLCTALGCPCFRGPLENVAARFLAAARQFDFDAFARISGDSPLLDQRLILQGVALFEKSGADLVTNVSPRTFPPGMSVEVVRTSTFERVVPALDLAEDREHVTRYFYSHADRYAIANFALAPPRTDLHLAVDTPDQLAFVAGLFERMTRSHWEYSLADVLELCDSQSLREPREVLSSDRTGAAAKTPAPARDKP